MFWASVAFLPAQPANQPAQPSPAQPAQPARPASPAFFSCFSEQNVSWASKTDVLRERGGNGQNSGSLVACVLPYKMLLGCQKRPCRARVVQQGVLPAAVRVVKHGTFSDFRQSAWYLRYFGACLFGGAKTYANMHKIVACGKFAW